MLSLVSSICSTCDRSFDHRLWQSLVWNEEGGSETNDADTKKSTCLIVEHDEDAYKCNSIAMI